MSHFCISAQKSMVSGCPNHVSKMLFKDKLYFQRHINISFLFHLLLQFTYLLYFCTCLVLKYVYFDFLTDLNDFQLSHFCTLSNKYVNFYTFCQSWLTSHAQRNCQNGTKGQCPTKSS